ncbi:hypothetical protein [Nostoc sp. NMS1]|uniref:hypothetical protein n=1 Tax=Nostoc sp. NMS1 TaxID=2815388 RepID=UPI0025EA0596|nr:hypothetical protein [Nostoc sp. NMS1]
MTNRQGRQERKGKRFVQVFCPSPVSFGKIGMLPLKSVWEEAIYNNPISDISKIEDVWVGEVHTHPLEFNLATQ